VHCIAEVVLRARDRAAVDHAFVDLTYRDRATSIGHAVDLAGRMLDLVRAR
jgi:hypothetical protein